MNIIINPEIRRRQTYNKTELQKEIIGCFKHKSLLDARFKVKAKLVPCQGPRGQ